MGRIKESGFKAQDIVLLLEAIKSSRITMLKYRGLEISALPHEEVAKLPVVSHEPNQGKTSLAPSDLHAPFEDSVILSEEEELEHLIVTDPEEFEKKLLNGELEDA